MTTWFCHCNYFQSLKMTSKFGLFQSILSLSCSLWIYWIAGMYILTSILNFDIHLSDTVHSDIHLCDTAHNIHFNSRTERVIISEQQKVQFLRNVSYYQMGTLSARPTNISPNKLSNVLLYFHFQPMVCNTISYKLLWQKYNRHKNTRHNKR